jgi:hypothetical protein
MVLYAAHKIRADSFTVEISVIKLITAKLEIKRSGDDSTERPASGDRSQAKKPRRWQSRWRRSTSKGSKSPAVERGAQLESAKPPSAPMRR